MEDTQIADTTTDSDSSSSAIDNYDFSKADGGLSDTISDSEGSDSSDSTDDNASRGDNTVEEDADSEEDARTGDSKEGDDADTDKMSDAERNNYFAQRRLAAKREAEVADSSLLGQLRSKVTEEFINVEPNEQDLEDMDPAVAEQLRELRRNERERQAEHALAQVQNARESTRLSVMQAESSIPLFNPSDKANYNQFFHEEALSEWAHRYAEVAQDARGEWQVVGTKAGAPSPHEYLQQKAPKYEAIIKAERSRGQQSAYRNRAGSEVRSSSGAAQTGGKMSDIESRIGDMPLSSFK